MGRTHGIHAEPVTFGFKILVWYEEVKRHIVRMDRAMEVIGVGRISGSVGTYIHLDPRVEVDALRKLGLAPAPVSTQVLQRDRHAEVMAVLALVAGTLEKIALEIRHLQRSEVLELEEPFTKGQKGSSSMPHKKNPVRCERISGLARIIRANLHVALENMPLWHERDISHSSAERVIFPDSFALADYMLDRDHRHRLRLDGPDREHEAEHRRHPRPDLQPDGPPGPHRQGPGPGRGLRPRPAQQPPRLEREPGLPGARPGRRRHRRAPLSRRRSSSASPSSPILRKSTTSSKGSSAMKVRILVSFKDSVLDPQGQTVKNALHTLGYAAVKDVRQGKVFELDLAGVTRAEAEPPRARDGRQGPGQPHHREVHLADRRGVTAVKFGVVVFPGSNCDADTLHAFKDVMGQPAVYLWHKDHDLAGVDCVVLPGRILLRRLPAVAGPSPASRP